jgi:hypothetical protein
MARLTGEGFRKSGFWSQLVLLGLIDWATIHAFLHEKVGWYHYVGFVAVNVCLLWLTVIVWRWLRTQNSPPSPHPDS